MDWQIVLRVGAGIALTWAALVALLWLLRPKDTSLVEVVRIVPDILRLIRRVLGDPTAPSGVRVALMVLLAWLLNPIDLIPEFVPVLGPLDDVMVAVLVLRYVRHRLGEDDFRRRWPGTEEGYALLSKVLQVGRTRPTPEAPTRP